MGYAAAICDFKPFKTKQEYNLGSLWELPVSFNAGIIFSNFKSLIANKLFYLLDLLFYIVALEQQRVSL